MHSLKTNYMHADLTDSIYEAASIADRCPSILQQAADLSGSVGSALFIIADGQPARVSTGVMRVCSVRPASSSTSLSG